MREEVFRLVAPDSIRYEGGALKVLLVDAGAKDNIVRSLLKRGASVLRAPWHADLAPLAAECDGVLIGNGPGDPKDLCRSSRRCGLLSPYRSPSSASASATRSSRSPPAATPTSCPTATAA